jgi:hypothetical protein
VPKGDLIAAAQVLLQGERLKIAATLPDTATLTAGLLHMRVRIDSKAAHDSYAAWRENQHDDLFVCRRVGVLAGRESAAGIFIVRGGRL